MPMVMHFDVFGFVCGTFLVLMQFVFKALIACNGHLDAAVAYMKRIVEHRESTEAHHMWMCLCRLICVCVCVC